MCLVQWKDTLYGHLKIHLLRTLTGQLTVVWLSSDRFTLTCHVNAIILIYLCLFCYCLLVFIYLLISANHHLFFLIIYVLCCLGIMLLDFL